MVTLNVPLHSKASNPHQESEHAIVRGISAFYSWLSGEGMTKQELVNRDIAESRPLTMYIGPTGF